MNWLLQLHSTQPVAHAIGVLALVCVAGMAIGSLKVRGVGLGTAGVLFAGTARPITRLCRFLRPRAKETERNERLTT